MLNIVSYRTSVKYARRFGISSFVDIILCFPFWMSDNTFFSFKAHRVPWSMWPLEKFSLQQYRGK